jgi:hypothetical protein
MSQPSQVSGQGSKEPSQSAKYSPDPLKFRKVLGVDKADETDQRGQRSRLRETEEEEGQEADQTRPDQDLFTKLMSDRSTKVEDEGKKKAQSFTVQNLPQISTGPSLSDIGEETSEALELQDDAAEKKRSAPLPSKKLLEQQLEAGVKLDLATQEKIVSKIPEGKDLQPPIKKESFKQSTEMPTTPLATDDEQTPFIVPQHTPTLSSEFSEKEKKEKGSLTKVEEKVVLPIAPKIEGEIQPGTVSSSQPSTFGSVASFTQLPPQILEMFEKLVGVMTVLQYQGVSTTSITLNMPNTMLDGTTIDIEHYDTAPHAFNIQIYATPQAQEYISQNVQTLQTQLRTTLPNFDITIREPLLIGKTQEEKKRKATRVKRAEKEF